MKLTQQEKYFSLLLDESSLDKKTWAGMTSRIDPLIKNNDHLIINAESIVDIDSEVAQSLINIAEQQAEKSCTFVIVNSNPGVVKAFDDELAIVPTEHEAIDYFNFDELERQYNL